MLLYNHQINGGFKMKLSDRQINKFVLSMIDFELGLYPNKEDNFDIDMLYEELKGINYAN